MSTINPSVSPLLDDTDHASSQGAADAVSDHNIPALGLSEDQPLTPTVSISDYGSTAIVSWNLRTDSDADPSISLHIHDTSEGIDMTPRLWVATDEYGVPATKPAVTLDKGHLGVASMVEAIEAAVTLFPGSPMAEHLISAAQAR